MSEWTNDELDKIEAAEELELASARHDGSLRKLVTIWIVRYGDDLYVRTWRGRTGARFRSAQDGHEGHISAGGVDKDVRFVEADYGVNDPLDAASRTKYHRYADSYVTHMIRPEARAAMLKLVPRS